MDVDEALPISAIEHHAYCPRQAALIHVEGLWEANAHTAQGDADHAPLDRGVRPLSRGGTSTWTSLPVWHDGLGMYGVCDTVEVRNDQPIPVEHKPTMSRWRHAPAAQQLTAQALCLEAMWSRPVTTGVIFTRRDHRRHDITITTELRDATRRSIEGVHDLIDRHRLPPPARDRRCDRCSLKPVCLDDDPLESIDPFTPAAEGDW